MTNDIDPNRVLESLENLKSGLGLSMDEVSDAWKAAFKIALDVLSGPEPSRWRIMEVILMDESLSRAQAVFAGYVSGQLFSEIGIEPRIFADAFAEFKARRNMG